MVGRQKNELERFSEAAVNQSRYYAGIFPNVLRKTKGNLGRNGDSNRVPSEHESRTSAARQSISSVN
jgi:hypothetical protein